MPARLNGAEAVQEETAEEVVAIAEGRPGCAFTLYYDELMLPPIERFSV
jgi:hypothetical protein